MTKRRLTSRQQARQQMRQTERAQIADTHIIEKSSNTEQAGLLVAHYGTTLIVENQDRKLFRCARRQNLGTLVTGDQVVWTPTDNETGVVVACLPRTSTLFRPDGYTAKPIVANVNQIIIVAAREPLPKQTTLDRYLILAETFGIQAILLINKADLPASADYDDFRKRFATYAQIGYPWLEISTKIPADALILENLLRGHTSIFMGQSGVGKSSLLTHLIPTANIPVQTLSRLQRQGRHTTTATRLYHLPSGGDIIDSPGVNQFNLKHLSPEQLIHGFKEFRPFLGQCKFRNCMHQQDPGCALLQAIQDDKIAAFRLENYHQILADRIK